MNVLHMRYAVEVAKTGSLSKASENLLIAVPNISRSIKELESDIGITIFDRTNKGMNLTPDGEEFINYTKGILGQLDQIERFYKNGSPQKQRFSISVPRACYISDAFTEFTKSLSKDASEIFYKETNSQRTIRNILEHDYRLGIIRYAENYDKYFDAMLEENGLTYETVTEFSYVLLMGKDCPLAKQKNISYKDLTDYIEIAHADPYVPSMPLAKVIKEELQDNITRRIFIFERASQFELLAKNPETFMWVSPVPDSLIKRYGLVQKPCRDNRKVYRDVLIYHKNYKLTDLDRQFIEQLNISKQKNLCSIK